LITPYQSEVAFQQVFISFPPYTITANYRLICQAYRSLVYDGRWLVQIKQDPASIDDLKSRIGAYGTVSDVVLIITDYSGVVHTFYQDIRAEIVSLPKYGSLYTTTSGASH
jgi:hypothetical protein